MSKSEFMLLDVPVIGEPSLGVSLVKAYFFEAYLRNIKNLRFHKDLTLQMAQFKGLNSRSLISKETWNPKDPRKAQEFWKDQDGLILVYDTSEPQTLENIDEWLRDCNDIKGGKYVGKLVIGFQWIISDQVPPTRVRREQFAAENKDVIFAEMTTADGRDIDKGFRKLVQSIIENRLSESASCVTAAPESDRQIPQVILLLLINAACTVETEGVCVTLSTGVEPGINQYHLNEGNAGTGEPWLKLKHIAVKNTMQGGYSTHFTGCGTGEEVDPPANKLELLEVKLQVGYKKKDVQGRGVVRRCVVQ